jgi:hypothetical protein
MEDIKSKREEKLFRSVLRLNLKFLSLTLGGVRSGSAFATSKSILYRI